tara:strand:+ start:10024 stop:10410 length:387 start_codon:yes stop_codon:yes gene_type:complete
MLKNIFRFLLLIIANYLVIYFSKDINLEQLVKDFELMNIFLSTDGFLLSFIVSFSITAFALFLILFFKPFIEIYLLYYLKYTFYFLVNLLSLSTMYIVFRIYGYSRFYLLIYLFISSGIMIISDKIKR